MFDLAGAAVGCLLLIPVLNQIGAINTIFFIAAAGGLAAALFSFAEGSSRTQMAASLASFTALAALLVHGVSTNWIDVQVSKGVEENRLLFAKWNSFSSITVEGDLQGAVEIKIDSDAATTIAPRADVLSLHRNQRQYIPALAYNLKPEANVLIIGPGGGTDVVTALVYGSRSVTAVEVNPIIAHDVMSSEPFKSYSGDVYGHPSVNLVVDEGRSFIRRSPDRYDLVQMTVVDTWAATSAGAFALTENNLYTVEAFADYATHLTDDGILTITRWYFEPPDQLLRLLSLTRAMMAELGIGNAPRHVMLIRDARMGMAISPATFLFKRSEFTDDEVRMIEDISHEVGFDVLYSPLTRPDNVFTRMMEAEDPAEVWDSFETNVAPTRDNNPFFFNSIRWSSLPRALEGVGEWQKTNLGTFVLFVVLVITTVLVILFILGPLVLVRRRDLATGGRNKIPYLLYFGCLGAGFIIVEVAMIQKLILFLGHPVYALAVVLFSLLLFSATGSYLTGRFDPDRLPSTIAKLLVVVVGFVLVYILALSPIFYGLVHLPLAARIAIAVALLAPLGVVMGMPMPSGIRMMSQRAPELIPWAWGVNGATSVMGSVAALVIAMLAGFNEALLVGSALYLLAIFLITRPQDALRA